MEKSPYFPSNDSKTLGESNRQWFLIVGNENRGPMTTDEIRALFSEGSLTREETLLWSEGMADWRRANETSEFCDFETLVEEDSHSLITEWSQEWSSEADLKAPQSEPPQSFTEIASPSHLTADSLERESAWKTLLDQQLRRNEPAARVHLESGVGSISIIINSSKPV